MCVRAHAAHCSYTDMAGHYPLMCFMLLLSFVCGKLQSVVGFYIFQVVCFFK